MTLIAEPRRLLILVIFDCCGQSHSPSVPALRNAQYAWLLFLFWTIHLQTGINSIVLNVMYLFLERGRGKEREEGKHQCKRETSIGCLLYVAQCVAPAPMAPGHFRGWTVNHVTAEPPGREIRGSGIRRGPSKANRQPGGACTFPGLWGPGGETQGARAGLQVVG